VLRAAVARVTPTVVALVLVLIVLVTTMTAPAAVSAGLGPDDPPPPPVTVNEFIPEDRDLSDCLSALPKPGCGSEARGGWRQTAVLGAILLGLGVVGWRISVGLRANRRTLDRPEEPVAPQPPA
jgi:hypothetical protein